MFVKNNENYANSNLKYVKIMQVDGENGDDIEENVGSFVQASLDFCKNILSYLQRESYDKFEILNLCVKFEVDASDFNFSKQKYLLKKKVIENIVKEDDSEYHRRLLEETVAHLNIKKDSSYKCCLVGCLFTTPIHEKYISHLRAVHVKYNRYLCQYKHNCERRFTSMDLLNEHMRETHSRSLLPNAEQTEEIGEATFKRPCKCVLRSCNGLKFVDMKTLMTHINIFHQDETRECIFDGCSVRFKEKSTSQNHFRLKHLNQNRIKLKITHLVMPDFPVGRFDGDEFNIGGETAFESEDIDVYDCQNDSDEELSEVDDENDDDFFVKAFADFMNRMCHVKFVPHSTMQTIAAEFLEHSIKSVNNREKALRKSLLDIPEMTEHKIDDIVKKVLHDDKMLKAQKELDTDRKRNSYIRENFNYVAPVEYVLNPEEVKAGKYKEVYHNNPIDKAFTN